MEGLRTLYLVCAVVGGTALVVQTILLALGGDTESHLGDGSVADVHDHAAHAADASFLKWLTLKGIVAFLTFFGLAGLASGSMSEPLHTLPIAFAAGLAALFLVGWLMRGLARLHSHGNLELQNALGKAGRVYLRIPPSRSGVGKVTVEVQGRSVEWPAVTAASEIPTGAPVRVVAVSGDLLEVVRVEA
jgi:membrane protein implicated in regulation of membrane protease activity